MSEADNNVKEDKHWFMKFDAMIRFNFGNYSENITDNEWAIMVNELLYIKEAGLDKQITL